MTVPIYSIVKHFDVFKYLWRAYALEADCKRLKPDVDATTGAFVKLS